MHAFFPRQPTPSLKAVLPLPSSPLIFSCPILHRPHHYPRALISSDPHIPTTLQMSAKSRRRILPNNPPNLLLIRRAILLIKIIRIRLRRTLGIDFIQQHLNPQQNLLDRDGGFPAFLFVEDRQADCAAGVDVWVEEGGDEFA